MNETKKLQEQDKLAADALAKAEELMTSGELTPEEKAANTAEAKIVADMNSASTAAEYNAAAKRLQDLRGTATPPPAKGRKL